MAIFLSMNVAAMTKDKPVQVIIPFGPGGGTDAIFRKLQRYGEDRNITMIPVYRPGAQGLIGMQTLYEAEPNGLTIGVITFDTVTLWNNKTAVDMRGIINIQKNIFGVVTTKNGSLTQLVNNSTEKNPLKIGYLLASQKVIMEKTVKILGIKQDPIYVPYKSGSDLMQNVIGGDLDIGITSLNVLAPLIKTNKMRLLATDSAPMDEFPSAISLNAYDPSIGAINKGSSIVLPPNSSPESIKFWKEFVKGYLSDPMVKADSTINYWEPVSKTLKELEKDLEENTKILKQP